MFTTPPAVRTAVALPSRYLLVYLTDCTFYANSLDESLSVRHHWRRFNYVEVSPHVYPSSRTSTLASILCVLSSRLAVVTPHCGVSTCDRRWSDRQSSRGWSAASSTHTTPTPIPPHHRPVECSAFLYSVFLTASMSLTPISLPLSVSIFYFILSVLLTRPWQCSRLICECR